MRRKIVCSIVAVLVAGSGSLVAQDRVAQLNKVEGKVTVTRASSGKVDTARQLGPRVRNGSIFAQDVVNTSASAQASVVFSDGSLIDLAENTSLAIEEQDLSQLAQADKPESRNIRVLAGDLLANVVPNPRVATRFETPSGVAAVKGTSLTISSVVWTEVGGDAIIKLITGDSDFIFVNGGTTSLTDGTEIFASWDKSRGLRIRVLFSTEPLLIRFGNTQVLLPRADDPDTEVSAVIRIEDDVITVENDSEGTDDPITVTDSEGNESEVGEGQETETIAEELFPPEGEEDEPEEPLVKKKKKKSSEEANTDDPCAAVVCDCGTCAGGSCVGTAGCREGSFCDNGVCIDPCEGAFCECGRCENGVCVGVVPPCPAGSSCVDGRCFPTESPTSG